MKESQCNLWETVKKYFKPRLNCQECSPETTAGASCPVLTGMLHMLSPHSLSNIHEHYHGMATKDLKSSKRFNLPIQNCIRSVAQAQLPYFKDCEEAILDLRELLICFGKFLAFENQEASFPRGIEWVAVALLYHGEKELALSILECLWQKMEIRKLHSEEGMLEKVDEFSSWMKDHKSEIFRIISSNQILLFRFCSSNFRQLMLKAIPLQISGLFMIDLARDQWHFVFKLCELLLEAFVNQQERNRPQEKGLARKYEWQFIYFAYKKYQ